MALVSTPLRRLTALGFLVTRKNPFNCVPVTTRISFPRPLVIEARANTRKGSAKVRSRRLQKKFNGSAARPRLSVFCSTKLLCAMLVDDQNKKCLFYASTLQKSLRDSPNCTTHVEATLRVGEELVKACVELNIMRNLLMIGMGSLEEK